MSKNQKNGSAPWPIPEALGGLPIPRGDCAPLFGIPDGFIEKSLW